MPADFVPTDVSAGLFNDDVYGDIAVVSDVTNNIYVYLGSADGSLQYSSSNPVGVNSGVECQNSNCRVVVHAADLDQDGDVDLAAVSTIYPGSVEVYLNKRIQGDTDNGNESFGTVPDSSVTLDPSGPYLAGYVSSYFGDKDGDGDDDLLMGLSKNSFAYLPNVDGEFENPTGAVAIGGPSATDEGWLFSATIGDFNGDGNGDVVAVSEPPYSETDPQPSRLLFAAATESNFADATSILPLASNEYVSNVRSVNLNGDRYDDLIFSHQDDEGDSVRIALGSASGPVPAPPVDSVLAVERVNGPSFGDFNGDGKVDVAMPQFGSESFQVALGDGEGHLALDSGGPFAIPAIGSNEFLPQRSATLDVNGDGRLDFTAASGHSGSPSQGRGVAVMVSKPYAEISVAPSALEFSPVTAHTKPPVKKLTIRSSGEIPVELGKLEILDTERFKVRRGTCPSGKLPVGSSCKVEVRMLTTQAGEYEGTLAIASNASGQPVAVPVSGRVRASGPILSLKVKAPKRAKPGKRLAVTVTLTNIGDTDSAPVVLNAKGSGRATGKSKALKVRSLTHESSIKRKLFVPVRKGARGKFRVKVTMTHKGKKISARSRPVKIGR